VGNRSELGDDLAQASGAHDQRVTADEQDVGDLGMSGDMSMPCATLLLISSLSFMKRRLRKQ
jgi:hypothetical protein